MPAGMAEHAHLNLQVGAIETQETSVGFLKPQANP